MLKKIFLLLFVFSFICSFGFITVSAEETTTEQVTEVETTTEAVTDPPEPETDLTDVNTTLKTVLYAVSFVGGCLIAQGFSFWKW